MEVEEVGVVVHHHQEAVVEEPLLLSFLQREEVGPDVEEVERRTDLYTVSNEAGRGARGGEKGEEQMSVEELKQINSQLYKFAMKNVLHAK